MNLEHNLEWQKAQRGELYYGFIPELEAARDRCTAVCDAFNDNRDQSRRTVISLWRAITNDTRPLPPPAPTKEEDDKLLADEPRVMAPFRADYGLNIHLGPGVFVNSGARFVDTCPITIGARTLCGPNCSFYSGTHPVDPALRMGINGPENGKPIFIGEDCWLGGNVIVLPGVKIGKGCSIGAGSVVVKDIPDFHVAAGNPARILRKIETAMDPSQSTSAVPTDAAVQESTETILAE